MTTNVERLRASGAQDGDWPEPSTYAPEGYGFARTGDIRSKLHLASGEYLYATTALCGVSIVGTPTEQTLNTIIDGEDGNVGLCRKCVLTLERSNRAKAWNAR